MPLDPEEQGDLFPREAPDSVLAMLERAQRRVTRLAPTLVRRECRQLLGEVALFELLLDRLERYHEQAGRFAPPRTPPPPWAESHAARLPPGRWRHRSRSEPAS